jgi:hypothetical protein
MPVVELRLAQWLPVTADSALFAIPYRLVAPAVVGCHGQASWMLAR